jgi:hypothetical protein
VRASAAGGLRRRTPLIRASIGPPSVPGIPVDVLSCAGHFFTMCARQAFGWSQGSP